MTEAQEKDEEIAMLKAELQMKIQQRDCLHGEIERLGEECRAKAREIAALKGAAA